VVLLCGIGELRVIHSYSLFFSILTFVSCILTSQGISIFRGVPHADADISATNYENKNKMPIWKSALPGKQQVNREVQVFLLKHLVFCRVLFSEESCMLHHGQYGHYGQKYIRADQTNQSDLPFILLLNIIHCGMFMYKKMKFCRLFVLYV